MKKQIEKLVQKEIEKEENHGKGRKQIKRIFRSNLFTVQFVTSVRFALISKQEYRMFSLSQTAMS